MYLKCCSNANLKWPTSWSANCRMTSLVKGSNLALQAPYGGGPPMVRFGPTLSSPKPREPNRKNSASRYSKFRGNSKRSTSLLGTSETLSDVSWKQQDRGRMRKRKTEAKTVEISIFSFKPRRDLLEFLIDGPCIYLDCVLRYIEMKGDRSEDWISSRWWLGRRFRSSERCRVFAWRCSF